MLIIIMCFLFFYNFTYIIKSRPIDEVTATLHDKELDQVYTQMAFYSAHLT